VPGAFSCAARGGVVGTTLGFRLGPERRPARVRLRDPARPL